MHIYYKIYIKVKIVPVYNTLINIIHNFSFTEPISCAYINRYGFRYCLFIGSILSVTWLTLVCFIENTFTHGYYFLGIIGGKFRKHSGYCRIAVYIMFLLYTYLGKYTYMLITIF